MEPLVSAGLVYLAHRTMPFLSWTPHTGFCPFSALRGHHEHHHTFNNPSRRCSSGWRRLLRTGTLVGWPRRRLTTCNNALSLRLGHARERRALAAEPTESRARLTTMDERSSRDPRELSPRKTAFAREILRRRREEKNEGWWRRHGWLATTTAALSIGLAVISRVWRRRPGASPQRPL